MSCIEYNTVRPCVEFEYKDASYSYSTQGRHVLKLNSKNLSSPGLLEEMCPVDRSACLEKSGTLTETACATQQIHSLNVPCAGFMFCTSGLEVVFLQSTY